MTERSDGTRRYVITEIGTDPDDSLAMYRVALAWAAARGDAASFVLRPANYDAAALQRLPAVPCNLSPVPRRSAVARYSLFPIPYSLFPI
ncbi:hypothetical protein, partial [Longimicrobium sp.]|uniref:hypothetical protein n=1 Tax=Longimicrobium sp. TaxID=2029185 RepID=UPI002E320B1B